MTFKSPMFLLAPAPPPRRERGHDYAARRGGYGTRYGRRCAPAAAAHVPIAALLEGFDAMPVPGRMRDPEGALHHAA